MAATGHGDEPIIEARGLGKRYDIVRDPRKSDWIINDVVRTVGDVARLLVPWRRRPRAERQVEALWALRDVTFDVARGEVLGLVGHNGAGKTTLLRVLSRITDPTEGRAVVRGRLQSLLEVGIGFHQELTGRENVYLKAAIHGLPKQAVARVLDAIVAFAEVEQFIDTPMKRYSAGMRSRLGLAIGMFLEHEVLVVDEALAVGDARFRARAMARIREAAREHGTTTLFVSHDLGQIRELCPRSLLMERGRVIADGPTPEVLDRYLEPDAGDDLGATRTLRPGEKTHFRRVRLMSPAGVASTRFRVGDPLRVEMGVVGVAGMTDLEARVDVETLNGQRLFRFRSAMVGLDLGASASSALTLGATIAHLPLTPGQYWVGVELGRGRGTIERVERALKLEVSPADPYGHGEAFAPHDGAVWVEGAWSVEAGEADEAPAP
ncbi:MAG: ABC transporter ATP-binding protein [Myxococcales bacterium]|nr:ABC transporter ATP-binding protein [Myxococcales bacterium]MCB9731899.1 ABC transporter ATP-binding protein [Deltaproteobacteria bacterium]